ncbi:U-box domain-containing protein 35-like isoform X2 [Mangifera indica]|uniref:U-box domain-containing protein 35-like isoform X2 n=1 Tax=Mangifera indica TaxID=29780 RepID=UPI001CF9E8EC|nr:U-box domain-containing protein 35-like isoform X2 [Mangifera indica]
MWPPKGHCTTKKCSGNGLVAVAIDKDKGSQYAIKWALDNLLTKGQTVILIHVLHRPSSSHQSHSFRQVHDVNSSTPHKLQLERQSKDLFLTFHCYCTRKDINCLDVSLEGPEIAKTITEYVTYSAIENLVLGAPSRHGFMKKFKADVPMIASKAAPDFCNVYVIGKGKISSKRNASRPAPFISPLLHQLEAQNDHSDAHSVKSLKDRTASRPRDSPEESIKSPFMRGRMQRRSFQAFLEPDSDISFISSGRPSTEHSLPMAYDFIDVSQPARLSASSELGYGSQSLGIKFNDRISHEFSSISQECSESGTSCSFSSQNLDEVEAEMRRLKLELKQTMDMYSTACKEALLSKQQAMELQRWRLEEERRLEEVRLAEETALSLAEKEKVRCKSAEEAAEAAKRIAELEAQRRLNFEMKAMLDQEGAIDLRYRRYTIDEIETATESFSEHLKIGEGGYGPVYKGYLDHTPVAVKVLRPDAAQGRSQFQQEIEILSCIRHPNMVLLLGACPEYGIIVYEYMANGSLEDCLFHQGDKQPISWQIRFRIAAEIATGLLFLHQTKPEPLVHRDLKPGNILLDQNYVSKIGDVGLARLVPAVAENVTQYRMTATAGTFCYIDPEYQQTGMLGVKSDVYSLGVMLLQLVTGKPPMGLTHYVETAIENGTLSKMLDPSVADWPMEETLSFAKLALQCAELRRKDRPDLGKVVLPELNTLREFAEENMNSLPLEGDILIVTQDEVPKSQSSTSSDMEKPPESTEEASDGGD